MVKLINVQTWRYGMLEYFLFALGILLLLKGSDFLLEGASSLAKKLNIHKLVIGLTIVALGTSLPELFVSIVASLNGNPDVIIGNIIGSNIANILLILGIGAVIFPFALHKNTVWKEIPFSLIAGILLLILTHKTILGIDKNVLTIGDGVVLLLFFLVFLYYTYDLIRQKNIEKEETKEEIELVKPVLGKYWRIIGAMALGIIGLYLGGKMTVDNAVIIAKNLGISEYIISATVIAIGTSLPELFVTIKAALRKEADLAIGNIVGSNIFNTLFILGIASLISPISTKPGLLAELILMNIVTIMLFAFMFMGQKHTLKRWQGGLFLGLYVGYVISLVMR